MLTLTASEFCFAEKGRTLILPPLSLLGASEFPSKW